jgi:hypothetical protein
MMDYGKTRTEAEAKKQVLLARQKEIPQEKKRLDEEMERIKRELIGIEQILDGLGFMDSDMPLDFEPSGFTDSIRKILSDTPTPLVPTQIRDALEAKGITGSTSKNLLINVHKVLERISDELTAIKRTDRKTAYQRKTPWASNAWDAVLQGMLIPGENVPLSKSMALSAPELPSRSPRDFRRAGKLVDRIKAEQETKKPKDK